MFTLKFGTTPMKTKELKQMIFRIIMAFVLFGILLYASIVFSAEHVVTIPDGDNTWKMTIHPQEKPPCDRDKPDTTIFRFIEGDASSVY